MVTNYTPVLRENYRVGVPEPGFYREIMNTDAEKYGGKQRGQSRRRACRICSLGNHPYSINLRLPPLAAVFLKLRTVVNQRTWHSNGADAFDQSSGSPA